MSGYNLADQGVDPNDQWLDLAVRAEAMTCQSCGEEVADYYTAEECDECGAEFTYDEAAALARLRARAEGAEAGQEAGA